MTEDNAGIRVEHLDALLQETRMRDVVVGGPAEVLATGKLERAVEVGGRTEVLLIT